MNVSKMSPFEALRFRDFRLFWFGYLISRIGSEMQVVAISWHIYLLTGSPLSLGLIGFARFLPVIFFSLLGGVMADKFDRKKLLIITQILMIFLSLSLAAATFWGFVSPLVIYFLIGLNSAIGALETPTRQSIIPNLVPKKHFMNAVGLSTIMWQTAVVLGPSISGFIIAYLGVSSIYLINALSFIAVIVASILIKIPINIHSKDVSFNFSSITHGLSFVFKTPIIYSTMLLDFFATFFSSATVLLPVFATNIFKVGPSGLGILYAAPSLGAIIAGLIVSSLGHIKNQGKILLIAVIIYGFATLSFGLSKSFSLSLIFLFIGGAGDVISTIIRNTIRQLHTPDYVRGRMVSVNMIFFMGGPQLGEAEAGVLAALMGTPFSVAIGGIGTIVATIIIAIFTPKLRKYKGDEIVV